MALGLKRGHAAHTCGRDRLPVFRVMHIARREDAGEAGRVAAVVGFDVGARITLDAELLQAIQEEFDYEEGRLRRSLGEAEHAPG